MESPEEPNELDRHVSINALKYETVKMICTMLDPLKIIPTKEKLPRDWRGLFHLCNIERLHFRPITDSSNPTEQILDHWKKSTPEGSTVDKLLSFLEELDRFDIVDDITPLIDEDVKLYEKSLEKPEEEDDQEESYDAFVLFVEDDINFASELINVMENEYKLKLCTANRDLRGGDLKHDAIIQLINKRCRRLIVILSDEFFSSRTEQFFLSYACTIGLEQRRRKVIPCTYKNLEKGIPSEHSCYFILSYKRAHLFNFWEKLRDNIMDSDKVTNKNRVLAVERPPVKKPAKNGLKLCLKSALHHETDPAHAKPWNHVKFASMVNLNTPESEQILNETSLSASNSANSLGVSSEMNGHQNKKVKVKGWFQQLSFQRFKANSKKSEMNGTKMSPDVSEAPPSASEKVKSIFATKSKKKVALAS